MPLKGFRASGPSPDSLLWRAVLYAIENGAHVVNNSWSCFPACPVNPLADEMVALARDSGVVIVTSAGNRETDVIMNRPENGDDVITVTSTGFDDDLSRTFTNFGWAVDLGAPGGGPATVPGVSSPRRNILSLLSSGADEDPRFVVAGEYRRLAGTSMAAPHVAGTVALLLAARPDLDFRDVRRILRQSALDLGAPGHDRDFGGGRLDVLAALEHPPLPDMDVAFRVARAAGDPSSRRQAADPRGRLRLRSRRLRTERGPRQRAHGVADDRDRRRSGVGASRRSARGTRPGSGPGRTCCGFARPPATARSFEEFRQLSLEAPAFEALASPGPDATVPNLDDDLVVWESARDPDDPERRILDGNLFVTRVSTGEEWPIAVGPAHQTAPSISDGVVAWLEQEDPLTSRVRGCVFDPATGECHAFETPSRDRVSVAPASVAGRVFWTDDNVQIRACRPNAATGWCEEYDPRPRSGDAARAAPGRRGQPDLARRAGRAADRVVPRRPGRRHVRAPGHARSRHGLLAADRLR